MCAFNLGLDSSFNNARDAPFSLKGIFFRDDFCQNQSMKEKHRFLSLKSPFLALLFGFFLSIFFVAMLEYLARVNDREKFFSFNGDKIEYQEASISPDDMNLPDMSYLTPAPEQQDYADPDNYTEAYKNFPCKMFRQSMSWVGDRNCSGYIYLNKLNSKRLVYAARYSFDSHALRVVPASVSAEKAQVGILFLGCSFTFGEGVDDEKTFANHIAEKQKNVNSKILASPGWGLHQLVHLLSTPDDLRIPQFSNEKKKFAVFTILEDSIDRAFNTNTWARVSPYSSSDPAYTFEAGELRYLGTFKEIRPFQTIHELISRSYLTKLLNISFPIKNNTLYERFADLILGMKNLIRLKLGIEELVVSVYPGHSRAMPMVFFEALKKRDIAVINLGNFPSHHLSRGNDTILGNGHPSEIGHFLYGEALLFELNKRGYLNIK
jgi:hypothetical protein